MKRIDTFGY